MKLLPLFSFFVFFTLPLWSQDTGDDLPQGDEPYPAPVSYADLSPLEANFIGLFNSENVTNLHVHAIPSPEGDYPFEGTPITQEYNGLLQGNLASQTFVKGEEPRAVMSMRGNGEELYLVRQPSGEWKGELALFSMEDGKLRGLEVLAYRKCNSLRCVQQDSWLQDVNGDGLLDIIQKKQVTRGYSVARSKTKVFLMEPDGSFKRTKPTMIDQTDYQVEIAK